METSFKHYDFSARKHAVEQARLVELHCRAWEVGNIGIGDFDLYFHFLHQVA